LTEEEAEILINCIRKLTGYMVQGYAGPITMVSQDEVFEIIRGEIHA